MFRQWLFIATLLLIVTTNIRAEEGGKIVFATAPTHSEEETIRLYTPLMDFLSQKLETPFVLETAKNFVDYSVKMRSGKYDMIFDGPHLTGWRVDNIGHEPLARLPGTIRIVVVAKEDSPVNSLEELVLGRAKVCAFTSPNMLTMAFLSHFPNPVRQPTLLRVQGFQGLVECLRSGKGEVAVLRDKLWNKMDQSGLKLVAAPKDGYPERTFSISTEVDAPLRARIREALLSEEGQQASQAILQRFKKDKLIGAETADYVGLGKLLNSVWGFHSLR